MIIKYGDNTESLSAEKTAMICGECGRNVLKVNGKQLCNCSDDNNFDKLASVLATAPDNYQDFTHENCSATSENK